MKRIKIYYKNYFGMLKAYCKLRDMGISISSIKDFSFKSDDTDKAPFMITVDAGPVMAHRIKTRIDLGFI